VDEQQAPEPDQGPTAEAVPTDAADAAVIESDQSADEPTPPAPVEFSWQASEYVQHHKNALWYAGVVMVMVLLCLLGVILKLWLGIAVFLMAGIALMVHAGRAPRTLTYELTADGLLVEGKLYSYKTFRSFSVSRDVAWHTIDLEPTQRFMPRMSMLFNDEDLQTIVDHFMQHLPRVDRVPDLIDRATRSLRF
jgi:hypothetical protein